MTKTSPLFQKQGKVDKCFVWVMSFFNACYQVVSSFHVLIGAIFFNWKCRHIMLIIQFPFRFHFALRRADTRVLHLSKDKAVTSRYRNDFPFSLWPIFFRLGILAGMKKLNNQFLQYFLKFCLHYCKFSLKMSIHALTRSSLPDRALFWERLRMHNNFSSIKKLCLL